MIVLFTDFGVNGSYIGQMKSAVYQVNPGAIIIDLFANAPGFNPYASAYLLSAHTSYFPPETIFLCVVDPGVGTDQRKPVFIEADGRFYVGPDNGLFNVLVKHADKARVNQIIWKPDNLSNTFHGRDLFAPIAAYLSLDGCPKGYLAKAGDISTNAVAADLSEIIYIDDYGNGMTGVRGCCVSPDSKIMVNGFELSNAATFANVSKGESFWYENSVGLVELAVNCGNAAEKLQLRIGTCFEINK